MFKHGIKHGIKIKWKVECESNFETMMYYTRLFLLLAHVSDRMKKKD